MAGDNMVSTDPTDSCKHCCSTRLLGRDPRLWVCEHCGQLLSYTGTGGYQPAPVEWAAEAYPPGADRPKPQDPHYEAHNRFAALRVGGLTHVEG